jgi:hypothetical protein
MHDVAERSGRRLEHWPMNMSGAQLHQKARDDAERLTIHDWFRGKVID